MLVDTQHVAYLVGSLNTAFLREELVELGVDPIVHNVMRKFPKIAGELQNATEEYIRSGEPAAINATITNLMKNVEIIK